MKKENEKIAKLFSNYMEAKSYAKSSIESYLSCLKVFLSNYPYPDKTSNKEIISYIASLESTAKKKQTVGALRILYRDVLKLPLKFKGISYPRKESRLPKCISRNEAIILINSLKNIKHTAILYLLYTSGMRRSELLNLKILDIESDRGLIRINQGKGNKDRYTLLTDSCLLTLRKYYAKYKPQEYLFEGQFGSRYSGESIVKVVKKAAKSIGKVVTPHQLRHSFATHLIEDGVPTSKVQQLLGHRSSRTTDVYTHLSNNFRSIRDLAI